MHLLFLLTWFDDLALVQSRVHRCTASVAAACWRDHALHEVHVFLLEMPPLCGCQWLDYRLLAHDTPNTAIRQPLFTACPQRQHVEAAQQVLYSSFGT